MRTSKQCMKYLEPSVHFTTKKYSISLTLMKLQHAEVRKMWVLTKFLYTLFVLNQTLSTKHCIHLMSS